MSRVYFHSPNGEAELKGRERAYGARICHDLALSVLRPVIEPFGREPSPLRDWLPKDSYVLRGSRPFAESFETWFYVSYDERGLVDPRTGTEYLPFRTALNTAIVMGSDPIRLLARIHGQCELHGWVDGPDRGWLADIIDLGRKAQIYRPGVGWEQVAELLRARDDEAVVMSYSVTETFPHPSVIHGSGWTLSDDEYDAFFDLPDHVRWDMGMRALRRMQGTGDWQLQLVPAEFDLQGFGEGRTAFDIVRAIYDPEPAAK